VGTGSNNSLLGIQPTVVVSANKQDSDTISFERTVCQIGRSKLLCANYSEDLLNLIELKTFSFPYSLIDENWVKQIQEILESISLKKPLYLFEPSSFIIIPNTLYLQADIENHLKLQGADMLGASFVANKNDTFDCQLVSSIPTNLIEVLSNGEIIPDICPVLESQFSSKKGILQVIIRDEHIDVLLSGKTLALINRFNADHANDILYFCVSAIEQAGFNIDDVLVNLSGSAEKIDLVFELFSRYFKNLEKLIVSKKVKVPYGFKDVNPATCWPTLNAHLCV
jgi:hypothetical protein